MKWSLGLVLVLLLAPARALGRVSAEALKEAPPAGELSEEMAAGLAYGGWKVMQGEKRVVCEIWPAKAWATKADFEPSDTVFVPLESGSLVGVLRFTRKGADFRGQEIPAGVYTLRYANQPVDGNHVGTFATRDFLVMLPASADQSAKPIAEMDLFKLSAQSAESNHPAIMPLVKSEGGRRRADAAPRRTRLVDAALAGPGRQRGQDRFGSWSSWARQPSDESRAGTRPRGMTRSTPLVRGFAASSTLCARAAGSGARLPGTARRRRSSATARLRAAASKPSAEKQPANRGQVLRPRQPAALHHRNAARQGRLARRSPRSDCTAWRPIRPRPNERGAGDPRRAATADHPRHARTGFRGRRPIAQHRPGIAGSPLPGSAA